MSEKQFEQCSLQNATHVEMGGKIHKIGDGEIVTKMEHPYGWLLGVWAEGNFQYINENSFNILGIKPMREIKPEPIEFEAVFTHYDGKWHPLYSLDDGVSYANCKKATFKCIQILEEEK